MIIQNISTKTIYCVPINKSINHNKSIYQPPIQPTDQPIANQPSTKRTCRNAALASVTIPQAQNWDSKPIILCEDVHQLKDLGLVKLRMVSAMVWYGWVSVGVSPLGIRFRRFSYRAKVSIVALALPHGVFQKWGYS